MAKTNYCAFALVLIIGLLVGACWAAGVGDDVTAGRIKAGYFAFHDKAYRITEVPNA